MQEDLYCKVYVTGAPDIVALKATIAEVTSASFDGRTARTPVLEIDVFDQSRHQPPNPGDDFVRWPAYLEIFAADGASFEAFVAALARTLKALQKKALRVVASCDFEDKVAAAMQAEA